VVEERKTTELLVTAKVPSGGVGTAPLGNLGDGLAGGEGREPVHRLGSRTMKHPQAVETLGV